MDLQNLNPRDRAKVVMLQKGVKPRDIAVGTGLALSYVYNLLSGHAVTAVGRSKVEGFLGARIWSVDAAAQTVGNPLADLAQEACSGKEST